MEMLLSMMQLTMRLRSPLNIKQEEDSLISSQRSIIRRDSILDLPLDLPLGLPLDLPLDLPLGLPLGLPLLASSQVKPLESRPSLSRRESLAVLQIMRDPPEENLWRNSANLLTRNSSRDLSQPDAATTIMRKELSATQSEGRNIVREDLSTTEEDIMRKRNTMTEEDIMKEEEEIMTEESALTAEEMLMRNKSWFVPRFSAIPLIS
jgi:hypothetical protein